jgi:thiamine pyrophosphate-dependent acetolactate synthase large subunit-like protein
VQIAHGYARASGQPMIAIVDDVVGLLHAPMGICYAAYSIMMSGRQGPVYMCYDAGLQEAALDHEVKLPPPDAVRVPAARSSIFSPTAT